MEGLRISNQVLLPLAEVEFQAIRAQGAGGQNVNKGSAAVHLRCDIAASSLPDFYKERLLQLRDKRISSEGIIVIKAQVFRTREKNIRGALQRLAALVESALVSEKPRKKTRIPKATKKKRLEDKRKRGLLKQKRRRIDDD